MTLTSGFRLITPPSCFRIMTPPSGSLHPYAQIPGMQMRYLQVDGQTIGKQSIKLLVVRCGRVCMCGQCMLPPCS
jgi:hypothetical protein